MRLSPKLFLSLLLLFSLQFSALAASGRPTCVKAKETIAHTLIVKAPKRKQFKETSRKFSKYTPLRKTGKWEAGWVEVQTIDGKSFWVRNKDLSSRFRCLTVRVKKTRLYKGPGNAYGPSEFATRGDVFLDKGGEDGWLRVENSKGVKAWINMDHIWKPTSTMRMSFEHE